MLYIVVAASSMATCTFSAKTLTETLFTPSLLPRPSLIFLAQLVQLIPPTWIS